MNSESLSRTLATKVQRRACVWFSLVIVFAACKDDRKQQSGNVLEDTLDARTVSGMDSLPSAPSEWGWIRLPGGDSLRVPGPDTLHVPEDDSVHLPQRG